MKTIYCVVLLNNCEKKLIVKSDSIESNDIHADEINWGLKRTVVRKLFYSPVGNPVNFSIPIREKFDHTNDACYEGFVLRSFGKYHFH